MSGVEVAGLVLGCLPLLIQGIESYNDGLDPLKSFMRWEKELPALIRKLRNQHVHYAQTIRILLEPITTEFQLADMLSGSGQLWKDRDMEVKLQGRLQDSYHAYQSTISDIERITKKIASKLDLERATELSRNDLEALIAANPKKNDRFEFRKRVKFGMTKKSIKALLEELDDCNKELERFTEKSEKVETVRKAVKPSFANRLQRIQKYATGLHETLSGCFSCACKSDHTTNLRLDQRGTLFASGKNIGQPPKTCFNVSFSSVSDNSTHLWNWQAAEIVVQEDEDDYSNLQPGPRPGRAKSVSFGKQLPPPYSTEDPAIPRTPLLEEVKDLCASIQQLYKSSDCIGFLFDTRSKLRGAYPMKTTCLEPTAGFVTLEELLNRPPIVNGRPAKLSKKQRYSLALTLASSTLQLNATPWFPSGQWGAKDIIFYRTSAGHHLLNVDHPYVAPKQVLISKALTQGQNPKPLGFQNKNTILLALAVALLELYFGVSAEKHRELKHGEPFTSSPWGLCAMVYDWADEEQENMSAAFSTAVSHCLRCFSDPSASLSDADFLQAAVEYIVLPLQDELDQFLGKNGP
ncbi:hypothetical protein P280DRAFT_403639 [Massarina eburnea CBS 473.64]|uniref:DUF7580 domain-containing protein n=1 Tax=Massarina eburnea CBS 473.64 TaxID=1395130 RepID=A0A6A6RTW5_9PLEO|nr:hypothetical protein P280DRAFT_403639 [Massarina eburnea CBS 473.64]